MFHKDVDSRPNRTGKEREWDGRGSGVPGWNTESESDVWEFDLDFKQGDEDEDGGEDAAESLYTTGELVQLRYVQAERAKEKVRQSRLGCCQGGGVDGAESCIPNKGQCAVQARVLQGRHRLLRGGPGSRARDPALPAEHRRRAPQA